MTLTVAAAADTGYRLRNISEEPGRVPARDQVGGRAAWKPAVRHAWYDARPLGRSWMSSPCVERALQSGYTGLLLRLEDLCEMAYRLPSRVLRVVELTTTDSVKSFATAHEEIIRGHGQHDRWVVLSRTSEVLDVAKRNGFATCLRAEAVDAASLHEAIECAQRNKYLLLKLSDPTNIPLELAIASLQPTSTILMNELSEGASLHDALISFGIMEVGSDGVVFSPNNLAAIDEFMRALSDARSERLVLSTATVTRVEAVGMGHRACVDLATIFSPREGMLIGSTSQGGILCCPEVFYLPYMELRPFRVNAGGVHAYAFNSGNRTNYLSELRGGAQAMIVGVDGRTRTAPVGRIKIEIRPLRLIEAEFASGRQINVLLQDDWHVRVYSAQDPGPLHVTELAPGTRLLGYEGEPGRHVGIAVDEELVER